MGVGNLLLLFGKKISTFWRKITHSCGRFSEPKRYSPNTLLMTNIRKKKDQSQFRKRCRLAPSALSLSQPPERG
jgi:hypothetical protein